MRANDRTMEVASAPRADHLRAALLEHLRKVERPRTPCVVLHELGLRRRLARADLVLVNGILHGYEIKSDRDSLRRLERQVEAYGEVFDRATLVASERHAKRATELIPHWWGVIIATSGKKTVTFHMARRGKKNPKTCTRALAEFLWRDAALDLLAAHSDVRGFGSRTRREIWDRLSLECTATQVARAVREHLISTSSSRSAHRF